APPRVSVPTGSAPVIGLPSARVHIVVFTDFECPYCLEGEQVLSQIRKQYGDKVALYYFNYPLPSHPHAREAAVAASCAAAQGRFAAYHDLLFAHTEDLAHADYGAWAGMLGLERAAVEACRTSGEASRGVEQEIREGRAAR